VRGPSCPFRPGVSVLPASRVTEFQAGLLDQRFFIWQQNNPERGDLGFRSQGRFCSGPNGSAPNWGDGNRAKGSAMRGDRRFTELRGATSFGGRLGAGPSAVGNNETAGCSKRRQVGRELMKRRAGRPENRGRVPSGSRRRAVCESGDASSLERVRRPANHLSPAVGVATAERAGPAPCGRPFPDRRRPGAAPVEPRPAALETAAGDPRRSSPTVRWLIRCTFRPPRRAARGISRADPASGRRVTWCNQEPFD
jgi:hypothetical protein